MEEQLSSKDSIFDRLASELPSRERMSLFDKLKKNRELFIEPLYEKTDEDEIPLTFEYQFMDLPWLSRIFYSILGLIKNTTALNIYEEKQYKKMGREIEKDMPGLYDYRQKLLMSGF